MGFFSHPQDYKTYKLEYNGRGDQARAEFTNQINSLQNRQAFQAGKENISPMTGINAAKVGDSQNVNAPTVEGSTINREDQQFRNNQSNLVNALQAQSEGNGPSLAQQQLKEATDRNVSQQMGLAAANRSVNPALAQRQLALGTAQANQDAARDSAMLRTQEQLAARQQLAGVVSNAREQDLGVNAQQAQLSQQANLANAGYNIQAGLANQAARNDINARNAELQQQASLSNQNAINQSRLAQAQMNQQVNLANLQASENDRQLTDEQIRSMYQGKLTTDQLDEQYQALKSQNYNETQRLNEQLDQSKSEQLTNMVAGASSAIGTFAKMSDKKAKKNIKDGKRDLEKFLSAISPKEYEYKDPAYGEGKHVSPMAQDLEKTTIGKSMVVDTPKGKMVDYGKGLGAILASQAMLENKIENIEEALKMRKGKK